MDFSIESAQELISLRRRVRIPLGRQPAFNYWRADSRNDRYGMNDRFWRKAVVRPIADVG
jgi:hypothetical protein